MAPFASGEPLIEDVLGPLKKAELVECVCHFLNKLTNVAERVLDFFHYNFLVG